MVFLTFDDADLAGGKSFTLAHISDPHISCIGGIRLSELLNKRFFGHIFIIERFDFIFDCRFCSFHNLDFIRNVNIPRSRPGGKPIR